MQAMFGRLLSECRLPMFGTTGADGKTIDLKETFNPSPKILWVVVKVPIFSLNTFSVINSILMESFWLAHLTTWASLISTVYLITSFLSLVLVPIEAGTKTVSSSSKLTWGLFACSINLQMFVTILIFDSSTNLLYRRAIYEQGILFFLVALDGFVIHRFPIRFKHIVWVYLVDISYLMWTGFHAASYIGNPSTSDTDPATDDDSLYSSLNWDEKPKDSAILAAILLCGGVPIMFLFIWSISVCIPKHYDALEEPKREIALKEEAAKEKEAEKEQAIV
jgi:hypothetical protein